ncbi:hypothetical protein [Halomonas sp. MCCC 1A11062]|uniref:hypothetical protein n=1 Tax=Halomonas sp. MCCC 1A11062 TaxID=2733485 RepID=UPI001F1B7589|nr:hypothetical protein [Halomonas sp. MCCC 1A11062]MCE8040226.1 hypothetical protein [Halomonas sp. MCCC 1A11062]
MSGSMGSANLKKERAAGKAAATTTAHRGGFFVALEVMQAEAFFCDDCLVFKGEAYEALPSRIEAALAQGVASAGNNERAALG